MKNQDRLKKEYKKFDIISCILILIMTISIIIIVINIHQIITTVCGWIFIISLITEIITSKIYKKKKKEYKQVKIISQAIEDNKN